MNVRTDIAPQRRPWNLTLKHVSAGLGSSLVMIGMGGSLWGWHYAHHQLAPLIATELRHALNRPIQLGPVERISPLGLRLGASKLPAIEGDRDEVTIEAIDISVSYADWQSGKLGLTVTLIKPHLFLEQNADGDWLEADLVLQDDETLEVKQLNVRDGTIVAAPFSNGPNPAELLTIEQVSGGVTLPGSAQTLSGWLRGISSTGGRFYTRGTLDLETKAATGTLNLDQMVIAPFSSLLPPGFSVQSGLMSSRLTVQFMPDAPLSLYGTATLADFGARVPGEPNPFSETSGQFRFEGQEVWIEQGKTRFGLIPFQLHGKIHLQKGLDLQATVKSIAISDFFKTFDLKVPFKVGGALKTDNLRVSGAFDHVIFSGTVVDAAPLSVDRVTMKDAHTEFTLDKQSDRLTLFNTEFFPVAGGVIRGQAQIQLGDELEDDVTLTATTTGVSIDQLAALYDIAPSGMALGQINATTRLKLTGDDLRTQMDWQTTQSRYPTSGTLVAENDAVQVRQATIRLPGGTVNATAALHDDTWTAQLNTAGLLLSSLKPELTGSANGVVQLAGNLRSRSPQDITATGAIALSSDATPLAEPLTAQLRWNGKRLQIQEAIAESLRLKGWIDTAFASNGAPEITNVDLNLDVKNYDLARLLLTLPDALQVNGETSLTGRVLGGLDDLQLVGQMTLENLNINTFAFAPVLQGTVQLNADRQGRLNLAGDRDRIAIQLDHPKQHMAFQLQRGQAKTQGTWSQNQLQATAQDVPLELLTAALPVNPILHEINGLFSGNLMADLTDAANPQATADIAIANLSLGIPTGNSHPEGDRLVGQVRLANGIAATDGDLFFGNSHLHLMGQRNATSDTPIQGELVISHGELQDVATILNWVSSRSPNAIASFVPNDVSTILARQLEREANDNFDPGGTFTGRMHVRQSAASELFASFTLDGEDWQMAGYDVDRVTLKAGTLSHSSDGMALVIPMLQATGIGYADSQTSWRSPDTTLTLNVDSQQQISQIQVAQLPLEILGQAFGSSLPLKGELQAIAHIDQRSDTPQITGEFQVRDPYISQLALDPFQVAFDYHDGRIGLGTGATFPFTPVALVNPQHETKQLESPVAAPQMTRFVRRSQRLILTYGLFRPSFAIADLETFATTGDLPPAWALYFDLANLAPADLRSLLTKKIPIHSGLLDDLLNSEVGNTFLNPISQVVYSSSQQQSVAALRAALALSVQDDHQISLLECLQNYPTEEIQVDLGELAALLNQFDGDQLNP